jgi:hypothetical protein
MHAGKEELKTGLRRSLCRGVAAMLIMGCGGCGELFHLAGGTAFTFMLAPPPQTYRLTLTGMSIPAEQLAGDTFPASLRKNIYVSEIEGTEILKHLNGIRLGDQDTGHVRAALSKSLDLAGLLNDDREFSRYQLATNVTENRSGGVADTTVTTRMHFVLTDAVTGETLLTESVATPYTVPISDELLYKDRVGRAMEGSIRGDIRVLLDRLSQVAIP